MMKISKMVCVPLVFGLSSLGYAETCQQAGYSANSLPNGLQYVLLDKPSEYKISADIGKYGKKVGFYSSEDGYIGSDPYNEVSGFKVSATKDITFGDTSSIGPSWVMVEDEDILPGVFFCRDIFVQTSPSLSVVSGPIGDENEARVTFGYQFSPYSKAALDPNFKGRVSLRVTANGISSGSSKSVTGTSGNTTVSVITSTAGYHTVSAEIFDGNFTKKAYLGSIYIPGETLPRPCPSCPPY